MKMQPFIDPKLVRTNAQREALSIAEKLDEEIIEMMYKPCGNDRLEFENLREHLRDIMEQLIIIYLEN